MHILAHKECFSFKGTSDTISSIAPNVALCFPAVQTNEVLPLFLKNAHMHKAVL